MTRKRGQHLPMCWMTQVFSSFGVVVAGGEVYSLLGA